MVIDMGKPLTPDRVEKRQTSEEICREVLTYKLKAADGYREIHIPPEMITKYNGRPNSDATIIVLRNGKLTDLEIPSERVKGHDKNKELIVEVPLYMKGEVTSEKLIDELTAKAVRYSQSAPDANPFDIVKEVVNLYVGIPENDRIGEVSAFTQDTPVDTTPDEEELNPIDTQIDFAKLQGSDDNALYLEEDAKDPFAY